MVLNRNEPVDSNFHPLIKSQMSLPAELMAQKMVPARGLGTPNLLITSQLLPPIELGWLYVRINGGE